MKTGLICTLLLLLFANQLMSQKPCSSYTYLQNELQKNSSLKSKVDAIEAFTRQAINNRSNVQARGSALNIITIPVVVHILYHQPYENISDAQVLSEIDVLNKDYRRRNTDTTNTPDVFKEVAADCEIEFRLATSDPGQRSTNGIIRKYSPVEMWEADDKVKFSSETGDDAWDAGSYLNIWICNLDRVAGYSSVPGGPAEKDGVVIGYHAFGTVNTIAGFDKGRTAVHEIGHWLNLKHIWGDAECGDDFVSDTPPQSIYTVGCPSGIRISCGNGPNGNMYMNYMDLTEDACMNMFTQGQKDRMRSLFAPGGSRYSILSSKGLNAPLTYESTLPADAPRWLHPQLYPNPANNEIILDLAYDSRWMGNEIRIDNLWGQTLMQVALNAKVQHIDVSRLKAGMYFISLRDAKGNQVKEKFVKL